MLRSTPAPAHLPLTIHHSPLTTLMTVRERQLERLARPLRGIVAFNPFLTNLRLLSPKTSAIPFHRHAGAAKSGELMGGGS
jgi:hypothetical protein